MPAVLRSLAKRGISTLIVALALVPAAAAQPADDPIAASNRMTDPWVAPKPVLTPVEAPWLVPAEPKGKARLTRIVAAPAEEESRELPARPTLMWAAPLRRPIEPTMPMPERPMMPCEPFVASPTPMPIPNAPPALPWTAPRSVASDAAPPLSVVSASAEEPAPRQVTTIRFLDETPPAARDDAVILAMIRRGGATTARVAEVRSAVERVCRDKAIECQTEVAGERQLRVSLTVASAVDWDGFYERVQQLPDIGEYGLLFEVHVKK